MQPPAAPVPRPPRTSTSRPRPALSPFAPSPRLVPAVPHFSPGTYARSCRGRSRVGAALTGREEPMTKTTTFTLGLLLALGAAPLAACGALTDDEVTTEAALAGFDPSNFVDKVTNPFFPLDPGTTFTYAITLDPTADQTITEVTRQTKRILGVNVIVVHDRALLKGKVVEDTFDYFKQDKQGNVRYFGEDTKELDASGNVITTEGSFHAGSNGADPPHIIMEANP